MSFKPYTEKIKKKKIGSIIPEADPRIKMIRIQNTANIHMYSIVPYNRSLYVKVK